MSALNQIRLTAGRMPDPARRDEVVALATFLEAAHVAVGDKLTAVIAGRAFTFTIVGAALSPEFVSLPAPGSFMPDDATRGVWAPRRTVERAAGDSGAFNTVALTLSPRALPSGHPSRWTVFWAPTAGAPRTVGPTSLHTPFSRPN